MQDEFGMGAGDVAPITYLGGSMNGDIVGGIINGVAQLGAAGINAASQYATNQSNQKIANEANELQKQMFDKSLSFEERKFAEQQYENAMARLREDTEVQRRAADLAAAGINPMLAGRYDSQTGWGSIAGGVVNGFTPVTIPNVAPRISEEAISNTGRGITEAIANSSDRKIKKQIAEIQGYEAQIKNFEAETNRKRSEWQEKLTNEELSENKANNLRNFIIENRKIQNTINQINKNYEVEIKKIDNEKERIEIDRKYKEAMATVAKYNAFNAKDANDIKNMATQAQIALNEALKAKWISEETRGYIHEALDYVKHSQDQAIKLIDIIM